MSINQQFDVFLSHNSKDKVAVRDLADRLTSRKVRPWLDERELVPGLPWQEALERIIGTTRTAAVVVGSEGFGPWEEPEMRACLSEFVHRKLPVIPILLPGASSLPELPMFLRQFTWVDFRNGITDEGLDRLVWGITGTKPEHTDERENAVKPSAIPLLSRQIREAGPRIAKALLIEDRVRYAITLSGEFDENAEEWANTVLIKLQRLSQDSSLRLLDHRTGSLQLILEGALTGFDRLLALFRNDQLSDRLNSRVTLLRRLQLVILLHGIRTRAEWQSSIRSLLEDGDITVVEPFGYGFFSSLGLWFPFGFRKWPIATIESKIRDAIERHRAEGREVIVLAHSYGSYVLTQILEQHPDIHVNRVLFCGSIVRDNFRWDRLPNRPEQVVNDAGSRDIWPIMAKSLSWGYGATGTFGFNGYGVDDRFHDLSHSDYFRDGFAEHYWRKWVHEYRLERTQYEKSHRPTTPLWKSLVAWLPIQHIVVVLTIILLLAFTIPLLGTTLSRIFNRQSSADAIEGYDLPPPKSEYPSDPDEPPPDDATNGSEFDDDSFKTLLIKNETTDRIRVYWWPRHYGQADDRRSDWSVSPPIEPNTEWSEDQLAGGGFYWLVVQREKPRRDVPLKWQPLGWTKGRRIVIRSDIFEPHVDVPKVKIEPLE